MVIGFGVSTDKKSDICKISLKRLSYFKIKTLNERIKFIQNDKDTKLRLDNTDKCYIYQKLSIPETLEWIDRGFTI